jgi:hypothetical protein
MSVREKERGENARCRNKTEASVMSLACKHSPRGSKRENLFSAAKRAFNYTNTRLATTSFWSVTRRRVAAKLMECLLVSARANFL